MANVSTPLIFDKQDKNLCNEIKAQNYFDLPFSEDDVLRLQQIFLTFGIHAITTKNIESGRKIIQIILDSLNHYQNIGAITHVAGLKNSICDIVTLVAMQQKFSDEDLMVGLDNFLTINPCFDFIWIESNEMFSTQDIIAMKNIFNMYHVEERMPVLIMTYLEQDH